MNGYYATDAWLLGSREHGEADRMLAFYSRELGRVDALAKGVRLTKSKLKGHLNLFNRLRILITPGKEYWRLLDADAYTVGEGRREYGYTVDFSRFFLSAVGPGECSLDLWEALEALEALNTKQKLYALKIETLRILGMLPDTGELGDFFTPRGAAFISGSGSAEFLKEGTEAEKFKQGIERILAANHMV